MSIEQQQGDDERRMAEEEAAKAEETKATEDETTEEEESEEGAESDEESKQLEAELQKEREAREKAEKALAALAREATKVASPVIVLISIGFRVRLSRCCVCSSRSRAPRAATLRPLAVCRSRVPIPTKTLEMCRAARASASIVLAVWR